MQAYLSADEINKIVFSIVSKTKYKKLNIPHDTIYNLILENIEKRTSKKELIQLIEEKLHNIIALYLGDADYTELIDKIDAVTELRDESELKKFSKEVLSFHLSSKERIDAIESFYKLLFGINGIPKKIADVACGLHPFGIPFMGLGSDTVYKAFDINHPRIKAVDYFIKKLGLGGGGYHQDILLTPPDEYFDIVFFFKEAHRFEKRKKGCLRSFFEKLNTSLLVVSLPVKNMDGRVNSKSSQDRLIGEAIDTAGDKLEVIDHYGERLYFIHKKNA